MKNSERNAAIKRAGEWLARALDADPELRQAFLSHDNDFDFRKEQPELFEEYNAIAEVIDYHSGGKRNLFSGAAWADVAEYAVQLLQSIDRELD